jgi:PAS domain S-box-containing protein
LLRRLEPGGERDALRGWTEAERLAALDRYAILDTPTEQAFDDLVRLASDLLDAPIAAVNLIAEGRQWFKAEIGLGVREMPLDNSICAQMMLQSGALVVPDLLEDSRFGCNPLVTSGPGLRFYAGEVLHSPEGMPLGTLCVLDTKPRPEGLTSRQRFVLKALARQVMGQLELRRAMAQRARAEALQRQTLLSVTGFAIVSTDLRGRVLGWNPGAVNLLGWTADEMAGQSTERIFTPEDRQAGTAEAETERAREHGRALNERWHVRKDGSRFWGSGEVMQLRDEAGAHVGYVKVMRDLTEQHLAGETPAALSERYRQSQAEAERQRRLYEAILSNTPDLAYVWDLDHRFIYANEGLLRMWGKTWDEAIGRNCLELGYPDWHAAMHDREIDQVIATRQPVRGEVPFAGTFGRRIYDYILVPVIGAAGDVEAVTGTTRDVTEAREFEASLKLHAERVQLALTAGAIIGTWTWDLQADRFTVDEAFARAFGLDPALGLVGISLEQVIATVHPDDKPGLIAAIEEAVARGGAYAHQYRVRRTDGKYYWIEANGRVHHAPDGSPVNFPGVLLDVEERRSVEAERDRAAAALRALNETLEQRVEERTADLMRAEEQLRQSQKMEAVGQLTGGLAHDFNNLLTGITGSLELLGTRVAQGRLNEVDRYVGAAQGAAKRAAALTHRLLAFSRRQTLDPKPTDVNRLTSGMVELIRRTVGPGIEVEVVETVGLWPTLVDPPQLENALLNLCINARDAMPGGGRITIEMANKWLDEHEADERDLPPGQYLTLCVTDTGTGMPPDVIAKAFDPFFTTKPIGQGTGLGLSMIYGFVRQSGGQVRIDSEVGQGTTLCLYLPRHYGDAAAPDVQPDLADAPRAEEGETVLVVDDEPTVRMLVTDVLEELGYAAIEAADGPSGLKMLQSDTRIDLLVTDVGLPGGMNGRQMADAARVSRPNLKVLFITGYAENAVIGGGHLEHGMHVLTKPFAMETLASRIKTVIGER